VPESFACVVEIPEGQEQVRVRSRARRHQAWPETLSVDGDPPDVMVCVSRGQH